MKGKNLQRLAFWYARHGVARILVNGYDLQQQIMVEFEGSDS